MHIRFLDCPGLCLIEPVKHQDERGFFSETYKKDALRDVGIDVAFVQDNHSFSKPAGVVRGLHYQRPPCAQSKLVRVVRGAVYDIAVDIRKGSPYFGQFTRLHLSAQNMHQLLIPKGFLHGFIALEPETEVLYKVDAPYTPDCDAAIRWDDPDLNIDWGRGAKTALVSQKDAQAPLFRDFKTPFHYQDPNA